MTQIPITKPLGEVLLQTGLVSAEQIDVALQEQVQNSDLKLGEILARRGWIKQETANFFAVRWPRYLSQRRKQLIGQYLRDASLLDLQQVKSILQEQSQTGRQFGELIVQNGWLKQETIDFFLNSFNSNGNSNNYHDFKPQLRNDDQSEQDLQNLLLTNQHCDPYQLLLTYQTALWGQVAKVPHSQEQKELLNLGLLVEQDHQFVIANPSYKTLLNSSWIDQELGKLRPFEKVRVNLFKLEERASLPFVVLEEVFYWTGREPFLTQFVCHAIYDAGAFIPANEENDRVDRIVQTHVIQDWDKKVVAKHFRKIIHHLTHSGLNTVELLNEYRQILLKKTILDSNNAEQQELLKLGLIVQDQGRLAIANRIYEAVFNESWVIQEITKQAHLFDNNPITVKGELGKSRALTPSPQRKPQSNLKKDENIKRKPLTNTKTIMIGLLLLGVLGILLTIFARTYIRNRTATHHFDQGNALLNQGDYEDAIAEYDRVLRTDGNYHQAWTNRGYAFAGISQYSQMLASCQSATIIDPQAVYAWNCQGEALHNLKKEDEAIAAFEQAIKLSPSDPVFWINKGESLLALGKYDLALSASQNAIQRLQRMETETSTSNTRNNELSIAWSVKGRVFLNSQRYSDALNAYETSLSYNSSYFPSQLGKGITLKSLEQYSEANEQFKQLLTQPITKNQQAEVYFYSGLTYCNLWQPRQAMAAFDNALRLKPNFEAARAARKNNCM